MTQRMLADGQITELLTAIGAAERIVRTTVPSSYSRHTNRFLSIWCFTLPMVLVESLGYRMIPAVAVLCWALFTIEEVGHIIEDPFNMPGSSSSPDDLQLELSFHVMREDIMERLPCDSEDINHINGDQFLPAAYDHTQFHQQYIQEHGGP